MHVKGKRAHLPSDVVLTDLVVGLDDVCRPLRIRNARRLHVAHSFLPPYLKSAVTPWFIPLRIGTEQVVYQMMILALTPEARPLSRRCDRCGYLSALPVWLSTILSRTGRQAARLCPS